MLSVKKKKKKMRGPQFCSLQSACFSSCFVSRLRSLTLMHHVRCLAQGPGRQYLMTNTSLLRVGETSHIFGFLLYFVTNVGLSHFNNFLFLLKLAVALLVKRCSHTGGETNAIKVGATASLCGTEV